MPVIEEAEEQETLSNVDDEENIDLTIDGDDITLSEKCKDSSPRDEKKESYAMSSEYEELSEYHNSLLKCIYQELFSRINVEEENIDLTTKHKFETTESKNCQEVGENQDSQAKSMMGYHDLTPQTNVVKNHVLLQKDEENIFKSERYTEKYENLSPKNEDAVENSASTADKELLKSQNESRESEIGESNAPTTENELFEQHQDPYSQSITEVIDHAFVAEDSNESSSSNLENIDNMAVNPREELFTNDENDNIYDKLTTNILENENQVLNNDQYPVKYQYYSVQSRRDHIMCNVNDNNDNSSKQEISTWYNSKMKSQTDESTYTDKTIINSNESTMGNNKFNLQIGSKHINVNVNRIKIPERFKENPKDTVKSTLEHFKYFRKNMPSPGISNTVISNGMKNYKHRGFNEENTPKKFSSKSFQSQDHSTSSHSTQSEVTSPICHDHIVPEVVYSQMLVANRRKMFAQSSKDSITSSKNSSFSEAENTDGSRAESNYGIEGLSVLNVLESLKQSITSSSDGRSIISSTKSFPDVSLESDGSFTNLVREKKSFWEKVSLGSSRSSDYPTLPKKTTKKLSEYERCRLIWKKPTEIITEPDEVDISRKTDIYRSADDILSMTASMTQQNMKNCKSLDNSLNECEMLTIEERKQMLLKQNYDLEKRERERLKSLKRKSVQLYDSLNNDNISKNGKIKSQIHKSFSPIMEKIKKFNSDCNLSTTKEENNNSINLPKQKTTKPNNAGTDSCRNDSFSAPEIPPKRKFSSQFKRAITFFQKLEEKSQSKTKPKKAKAKHFSLNINSKKGRNRKRGGSLNLTNISDRFSVDNIYEDVIGNKKGSFKGRPNRTALVEALATFSRKENYLYDYSESEDDIKYDMFKNHVKRRKRKSIKSIFDVYY
ncbi:hypothetical protein JTB14_005747 [Gonioctena quinquepunctata]|nr:hypothetical protein JTB14_005747 [Gonioctena quinquepunctata]